MSAKLEIEVIVETWKEEKNGFRNFEHFCDYYGYDINNLQQYFLQYADQQSASVGLTVGRM